MTDQEPPRRKTVDRAALFEALLGFFSVACIVGGAGYGLAADNWLPAIFLALVGIWVEVGD